MRSTASISCVVVPRALTKGDVADVAAALAPRPLRLDGTVDGWNRTLSPDGIRGVYRTTFEAYRAHPDAVSFTDDRSGARPVGCCNNLVTMIYGIRLTASRRRLRASVAKTQSPSACR